MITFFPWVGRQERHRHDLGLREPSPPFGRTRGCTYGTAVLCCAIPKDRSPTLPLAASYVSATVAQALDPQDAETASHWLVTSCATIFDAGHAADGLHPRKPYYLFLDVHDTLLTRVSIGRPFCHLRAIAGPRRRSVYAASQKVVMSCSKGPVVESGVRDRYTSSLCKNRDFLTCLIFMKCPPSQPRRYASLHVRLSLSTP